MTENAHACVHSIDFTQDEIDAAVEDALQHQAEFLSDTAGGKHLRGEVLRHFKETHQNDISFEQLAMHADLEDDIDAKNACMMSMHYDDDFNDIMKPLP